MMGQITTETIRNKHGLGGSLLVNILYNMDTYRLFFKSMLNIVGKYYINKGNKEPGALVAGYNHNKLDRLVRG